jgi:hypothetical protein
VNARIWITLALAASAGGCALAVTAGADYAPDLDLSRYTSFAWTEPTETGVESDPRLESNPLFHARVQAAITIELHDVGINQGVPGAGLLVHYHAVVRDRVEVYETDERDVLTNTQYEQETQVVQFEEGTILVDLADAQTGDVIWRGWAQFPIGRALVNPEVMGNAISQSMSKMFQRLPVAR